MEKRKLANQQEFDLKIAQITAEEKMQQMKRKQTLAEMQLLKLTLEDENKQTPGNASTIKSIADLTELMNEMADGGSFAKSISTSASMSRQLAENMKKANDSKLEDAVTNSKRALENASALNDVLNTAGDAFSGALNDSFNALFDSLSYKTKSLSESLKDIARSFIKTLQKAITQRFIVDPILDALDNLINPNKKNPGQLIKQAHVQGATTVGNTIVAGAKVQKAALESGADTIKDKMEEALQNMIEVCCCKEPPKVGGDPVDVTNVNEFEKAFERALNNKQKDDDIIDILRQGITMAAGGMGGGEEMPTGMGYPRGSEPVEPGMTSKMLDFLIGEKGDHAFRDGEYLGRVLETDLHGPPEPGTVRREDVDIFSGDQVSHDQRAGGFFGEGGPIEGLGKNLKSTFGTFTEKLGNLFSGEGDFLAKLGDVFTSGGDIFTNLFSDFGGIFSDLLGGLTGGLSDMLGGLLGGAGGGGGGIMDLISMGAGFFGFANGGYTSQMKDYSDGGVAKGSRAGYPAILHGNEAVVPLPGGNKIPVEMSGAPGGGTVNAGVTVNINQATGAVDSTTEGDAQDAKRFAEQVSLVVRREVQNQQRSGGLLSPYGGS